MDKIKFEILEDGTITTETEGISGQNHQSADELMDQLMSMMGGDVVIKKKQGHTHSHIHVHKTLGGGHTHGGEHHHH